METPDYGPLYAETNWDAFVREPFNAASAAVYSMIAVYWLVRLHSRRSHFRFLYGCMWLLLVGGAGGTLYHAFRVHWVFLLLDALPIAILGLATAIYCIRRLSSDWIWVVLSIIAVFGLRIAIAQVLPRAASINAGYGLLGLAVLTPLVILALRTGEGLWNRVVPAGLLFAVALGCRAIDMSSGVPFGTHGFWHLFAAAAVWLLISFLEDVATSTPSGGVAAAQASL